MIPPFMSTDSETRKKMPIASGVLAYFPDALLCVAWISRVGNEKHNPGEPLHWAKEKSGDEPDAEVRHLLDFLRGDPPDPGLEELGELGHLASKAWRALAHLQRACDRVRAEHTATVDEQIPYSLTPRPIKVGDRVRPGPDWGGQIETIREIDAVTFRTDYPCSYSTVAAVAHGWIHEDGTPIAPPLEAPAWPAEHCGAV